MRRSSRRARQQGFGWSFRGPQMLSFGDAPAFVVLSVAVVLGASTSPSGTQSTQSRELVDLRTEYSTTVQNANGTRTTTTSIEPIHFRAKDGRLRPISTRLVPHGGASVINEAAGFRAAFDKRAGRDFVRVHAGGSRFGLTLAGAKPVGGAVSGSGITYRDVVGTTDLEYETRANGLKETLVLAGPDAPAAYRFRLTQLDGAKLRPERRADGSWILHNRRGGQRFVVQAPWAVDARGAGMGSSGAKLSIEREGEHLVLVLSVSRRWLTDERRAFPVRLDPSISISVGPTAAFNANCDTCPGYQFYDLRLGTNATEAWRSAVSFSMSGVPEDATITNALLEMRFDGTCLSPGCTSTAHTFNAYPLQYAWSPSGTSYAVKYYDTGLLDSATLPAGASPQWLDWTITDLARAWHTGARPNYGLIVKRSTEPANANGIKPMVFDVRTSVTYRLDAVTLLGPQVLDRKGATVRWTRYGGAGFTGYDVHRSETSGFAPSAATRLATITDPDETIYADTSARPGGTFYYKIVTAGETSNQQRADLPGASQPARSTLQPGPDELKSTAIANVPAGSPDCTNKSHDQYIYGGAGSHALLEWDLGAIPPESRVSSAHVRLYRVQQNGPAAATLEARAVTREWREAQIASCVGDGATWSDAQSGVPWTAAGGDAGPVVDTSVLPANGNVGWQDFDITELVQEWIAGGAPNNGVLIKAPSGGALFASEDYGFSPALRPVLEIVYEDPTPVGIPTAAVIAPRDGDRVRDTIAVEATAGDDRRVERVEFLLDGAEFSEDASAPYAANWDTRLSTNGSHTLRARAVDDAGNVGLSAPVNVDVANFAPPTVTLTRPPTGYANTVGSDSPAGHWRLGETAGTTATDVSGNGRHGTYTGSYALNQAGLIAGDADRSARLTSGSGSVSLPTFSGLLGSQFAAEAWIKHPGLGTNNTESRVVSRNAGGTGGWKLGVRRTSAGAQEAFFTFGTVTAPVSIAPSAASAYHLVGTYDGTRIRLYLDGREVTSAAATGTANTTFAPLIGGAPAADLNVDEVALYPAALTAEQVRAHFEVGQGRSFWVEGSNELRATAAAAPGRTLREVQFLVDDQLVAADNAAPYSVDWDTAAAGAQVPDGPHVVTARAIDDHDRDATTAPLTVNVGNNKAPDKQAQITAVTALPETLVDESGPWDADVQVDIRVKNTGNASIASGAAVLRYRWIRPDGTFDDSVSTSYSLGASIAPGAERIITVTVRPPNLPAGMARSRMTLRFDLRDVAAPQTWWASRGNPPLDTSVLIQREGQIGLGLERYYHYDGEELGGGMTQLTNLASGNNILRFSPFAAPGRGLSTVVDLTYNAQAGEARGSAVGAAWWLSVSSLSPFGEPLRCGIGTQYDLKPKKCEELALEGGSNKTGLAMDLMDGDGTVHRFTGRRTGGRTFWVAPQGVHLYLRQVEADEQPACDITENGMAYTSYQPSIRALWAFTRPDGATFYYQRNGWPTGVADRNGNCLDFELVAPSGDQDRVRVTQVVDAAGVATPALRARRAFTLEYYDSGHHHKHGGKDGPPKVKAIRDHTGSRLSFEYYKDDRLNRLTQEGGTTADGLAAPTRSWSFTHTRWWDDDDEFTTARIASASDRANPDHNIKDNSNLIYSVRDPRGNETKFEYYGRYPSSGKATRLKQRTDRAGRVTTYAYDTSARTTTVSRPLGRNSRYEFDAEGSLLRSVDKVTATREDTTSVSWTADRHVFKLTEPNGVFTEFAYDQNGYLTKRWDQLRRLTELQYENIAVDDDDVPAGWVQAGRTVPHISQLTKRITPRGKQWLFDHQDSTGNLLKLTDPEGFASRYDYNADGTLLRSVDGLLASGSPAPGEPDRTTLYEAYDANGLPTKRTDPVGAVTRFCNDDDGLLRWVQDPRHAGSPVPADWSLCVQHAGRNYRSYFDYDPFHRLARTSDPKNSADANAPLLWTHARYDANDNLADEFGPHEGATFRDGAGTRTRMTYEQTDRPLTETLFDFNTTLQSSNQLDRIEREETTQFEYDPAGRLVQLTTPRGVSTASPTNDYATRYDYDLLDRPLIETRLGVGEQRLTHFCYDVAGDLRSVTNPRANVASVACGADGAPAGTAFTERREYTGAHELKKVVDPSGDTDSQTYDLDGNPEEHTDAEGAKVTNTYDGRDLVTQIVEDFEAGPPARRLTTKIAYDAVGNQRHLYSPRAVEAAAPANPTAGSEFVETTEYDGLDRPVRILLPKQGSEARRYVHRRYDSNGNLTHVTVPVTESSLATILGSTSETRRWVTQYEHLDPGWIRRSENQNGPVIYDYTPEGWQSSRKPTRPPGSSRDTFRTYYRDGLLETFADEKNNLVLRNHDRNGNLTFLRDAGVSSDRKPITLDLDHNGFDELTSTTATEENRNSKITTYAYNLDGLVQTRNDDREMNGSTLVRAARRNEFSYDADGRVTLHEDFGRGAGRSDDKRITQSYFATDRERERIIEQWIGSDASGSFEPRETTRREYFGNGLLRTLRTYGGSGDELRLRERHSLGYRDPGGVFVNGHRTSDDFFRKSPKSTVPCQLASDNCVQRWKYDGGDRLVEENDGHGNRTSYKLMPAGGVEEKRNAETNALKTSAEFDGTRISTFTKSGTTTRLQYDTEGNLDCTTAPTGTGDDCNGGEDPSPQMREEYSYDYRNRLSAWRGGTARKTFDHDAIDRVTKEVDRNGSSTSTHELSYLGATRDVSEEQETGERTITRSYSYDAAGRRMGLTFQRGSGSPRELTYAEDPHGNVSLLINEAGDVKASYGYTAYGETDAGLTAERLPDSDTDPGAGEQVNPFRYSGKRTDATSGTIDMGARQFGPELGQFLQEDRFDSSFGDLGLSTDPLTNNRYALAGGNPVSFVEWDGHAPAIDATGDSKTRKKIMDDFVAGQNRLAAKRQSSSPSTGGAQAPDPDPEPASEGGGSAPAASPDAGDNNKEARRKRKAEKLDDAATATDIGGDLAGGTIDAHRDYHNAPENRGAREAQERARRADPYRGAGAKVVKYGGRALGPAFAIGGGYLQREAEIAEGTDPSVATTHAVVSTSFETAGASVAYGTCALVTAGAGTLLGCPFAAVAGGAAGGKAGDAVNDTMDYGVRRTGRAIGASLGGGGGSGGGQDPYEKGFDMLWKALGGDF